MNTSFALLVRRAAIGATILAVAVAGHAWAAWLRASDAGGPLDLDIVWSSVWLWLGIVGVICLACGAVLSWQARGDQARLESRFRRDGAP